MRPVSRLLSAASLAALGACAAGPPPSTALLVPSEEGLHVTRVAPGRVDLVASQPLHLYVLEVRPGSGRVGWPLDAPRPGVVVEGRAHLGMSGLPRGYGRLESQYCNRPGERMTYVWRDSQRPVSSSGSALVSPQARPVQARGRVVYCSRTMETESAAHARARTRILVLLASPEPFEDDDLIAAVEVLNQGAPAAGATPEQVAEALPALLPSRSGTSVHLVRLPPRS